MTVGRGIVVKKLPEIVSMAQADLFVKELAPVLERDRPCLVFDFSDVRQIDSAGIEMLLRCMEEAMKRNGDIKLAAVPPQAAVILELTRVERLFEIFEKVPDAIESFHRFPVESFERSASFREKNPMSRTS